MQASSAFNHFWISALLAEDLPPKKRRTSEVCSITSTDTEAKDGLSDQEHENVVDDNCDAIDMCRRNLSTSTDGKSPSLHLIA